MVVATPQVQTMTTNNGASERKQRASHLQWIKVSDLNPSPRGQRDFRQAKADQLASKFNLEGMGFPVVSKRDGACYIVDGQHRIAALKILGFEDDTVQCEVYEGLSEEEEAELFLERNDSLAVAALDKFRVALTAGREKESHIEQTVRAQGLHISASTKTGIKAVGALRKSYDRIGILGLGKVLRIIRDAYGDMGLQSSTINGLALAQQRYGDQIEEAIAIERLSGAAGGINGLLGPAERARLAMRQPKEQCIAAQFVSIYNTGRGGKKLAAWWTE